MLRCGNTSVMEAGISPYYLKEIHSLLCMWLRNSADQTTKTSTYMKHGFDETQTQHSLITSWENNRFGHIDLFLHICKKE